MAGNITDLLDRVTDSSTGRPIIGELASPGKAIGAASLNITAATNWTTESAIHFSIYETQVVGTVTVKDTSTQTDWKGTLAGTTISSLTLTGGTDRAYTAGAIVEITPTARYAKDIYDHLIVGHNQNGTHKAFTESNIVPTAALQDNAVTTAKITDKHVTAVKLADSAIYLGSKSQTANHNTGAVTTQVDITGFSLTITMPTTTRQLKLTLSANSVTNASGTGTDTTLAIREGVTTINSRTFSAPNGVATPIPSLVWIGTPTAGTHTYQISTTNTIATNVQYNFSSTASGYLIAELI